MIVYNGKTYAATINFHFESSYNAYAKEKGIFSIKGVHDQEVTKHILFYFPEELDMQFDIFPQLILRMGELELDSDNREVTSPFFIHMLQDIRASIEENNKKNKVQFDLKVEEKKYSDVNENGNGEGLVETMIMTSREAKLAKISVYIQTLEEKKDSENFEKLNYEMKIIVKNLVDHEMKPFIVSLPMISRNVNDFKKVMADIHEYLGLDKYSNNNKENYMNLVDFLS